MENVDEVLSKEKARLEEALSSESGQQQLAIRTYKIQLTKQTERLHALQTSVEQAKVNKEEKRNIALEVSVHRIGFVCVDTRTFHHRSNNNSKR